MVRTVAPWNEIMPPPAARERGNGPPGEVERFFALLTERQIKRGVHRSVTALQAAINDFINHHNHSPKPFAWTKNADDILASIERFCTRTLAVQMLRTSDPGHWGGDHDD